MICENVLTYGINKACRKKATFARRAFLPCNSIIKWMLVIMDALGTSRLQG
jgi:hypothetical protein